MLLPKYVPTEDSYIKVGNGLRKRRKIISCYKHLMNY